VAIEEHPHLKKWAGLLIRRPVFVILCSLAVILSMGVISALTPADLSFTGLLNQTEPEVKLFRQQLDTFGASSMLVLLVQGEPETLNQAVALFVTELPKLDSVSSLTPPADPQWLMDRAAWLWPRQQFDRVLEEAVKKSPDPAVVAAMKGIDNIVVNTVRPDAMRPSEKAALITMELPGGPLDMAMGGGDYRNVEKRTRELLDESGLDVTAEFTGLAAFGAQDQHAVLTRIKWLTPLTLIMVLILLRSVETHLSRICMAGIALGGSILIAFGMVGLIQGRLSILVTFFGLLLIGLGIDFGIHLLVSLRDGRSHGLTPDESLTYGVQHTGMGIALGGISTAMAFGVVAFTPEPGARDMGLAAVFGLLAAMILMLTFLPASWLVLERRHMDVTDPPPRFSLPGLYTVVELSLRHPKLVIATTLILMALVGSGIRHYHLEGDLKKIVSRGMPALEVEEELREIYKISPVIYSATAESLDQARKWTRELKKLPDIAKVNSAADFLFEDTDYRQEKLEEFTRLPNLPRNQLTERLLLSNSLGPVTMEGLPPVLAAGQIGRNGELALRITPKENLLDGYELKEQIDNIRAIAPTATGMPVIVKMAVLGRRDYVPILIPAITIVVTLILAIAFRNWRDVVLAMLPVVVGAVLAFGMFFWFGLMYNTLTGAVVPVILGLGVDDGIHVVERLRRYKDRNREDIHEAVEGVGRAIFLTTATTVISFIGLLMTNHAGMESIAYFMLMGVPLCFVASVTVLPAAALLLSKGKNDVHETD
jgi:predicted RND superfamily exporter protein